jgi:hypothetical protein
VVHAGLDILRAEVQVDAVTAKGIVELVEDIFQSSQSAIDVLNDLLSYEHIDAGAVCTPPPVSSSLICFSLG